MKAIKLKAAAALISASLFVSCQNPAGTEKENIPETENKRLRQLLKWSLICYKKIDGKNILP